jgi:hypothetical protein
VSRALTLLVGVGVVALSIGGCTKQRIGLELYDPDVYTRAEADAIQAEVQCKELARTPVQIARCIGNRR